MPKRVVNALTDKQCRNARDVTLHDGQGLFLVAEGDGKSWLMRYQVRGSKKRLKIGLGPYPVVTLQAARERKLEILRLCRDGVDPKAERDRQRGQQTLAELLASYMKSYNGSDAARWEARVIKHMQPLIDRLVPDISHAELSEVFQDLAGRSASTAEKVIPQVNMLFEFAFGRGMIEVNPVTRAKLSVKTALAGRPKSHFPMVAPADAPKLYAQLSAAGEDCCLLALRLLMLCPARSSNVRSCRWEDIDLERGLWTVRAEDTKTGKASGQDFVTPLSNEALLVLERASALTAAEAGHVFPGARSGRPMSDATMAKRLKTFGFVDPKDGRPVVPHGLRATFKSWSRDHTTFDDALIERALDHAVKGDVQKAYDRAEMIERRRVVMEAWAGFLTRKEALDAAGNVVAIR